MLSPLYSRLLFSLTLLIAIGVYTSGNNATLFFTLWVITCLFKSMSGVSSQRKLHTDLVESKTYIPVLNQFLAAALWEQPHRWLLFSPVSFSLTPLFFCVETCFSGLICFNSTQCTEAFTVSTDSGSNYFQWQQYHISVLFFFSLYNVWIIQVGIIQDLVVEYVSSEKKYNKDR